MPARSDLAIVPPSSAWLGSPTGGTRPRDRVTGASSFAAPLPSTPIINGPLNSTRFLNGLGARGSLSPPLVGPPVVPGISSFLYAVEKYLASVKGSARAPIRRVGESAPDIITAAHSHAAADDDWFRIGDYFKSVGERIREAGIPSLRGAWDELED